MQQPLRATAVRLAALVALVHQRPAQQPRNLFPTRQFWRAARGSISYAKGSNETGTRTRPTRASRVRKSTRRDTLLFVLRLAFLIVIDIVIVAGISIGVGATAPRWRGHWFTRDFGPLHLAPWESPQFFRAMKTKKLAARLPELGATFGGTSKNELPSRDAAQIDLYLIELRRAEWVHWISLFSWIPIAFFNPWYLTLLFILILITGNTSFLLILRHNRQRLLAMRARIK